LNRTMGIAQSVYNKMHRARHTEQKRQISYNPQVQNSTVCFSSSSKKYFITLNTIHKIGQ
jgi:hypothetical protein